MEQRGQTMVGCRWCARARARVCARSIAVAKSRGLNDAQTVLPADEPFTDAICPFYGLVFYSMSSM